MFKSLTDLGYKRTALQAFGFYLAYFILGVIGGGLIGALIGVIDPANVSTNVAQIVTPCVVVYALVLSFLIVKNKSKKIAFKHVLLIVLSGVLALFGAGLLGIIPAAYLTTLEKK